MKKKTFLKVLSVRMASEGLGAGDRPTSNAESGQHGRGLRHMDTQGEIRGEGDTEGGRWLARAVRCLGSQGPRRSEVTSVSSKVISLPSHRAPQPSHPRLRRAGSRGARGLISRPCLICLLLSQRRAQGSMIRLEV